MSRISILFFALVGCNETNIGVREPRPIVDNSPDAINPVQLDRIVQIAQPKVDILFVIDNSCSMDDEQAALSRSFPLFMSYFQNSGLSYHIGVTTTDMENPTESGKLRRVNNSGQTYRFIDEDTLNPVGVFGSMAVAGTGGSATETGRRAAYALLETNRDLPRNAGFYREEASLHIIYVSDEDDQSDPVPPRSEFMDWMRNLKWAPDMVTSHAIVAMDNGGCGGDEYGGAQYRFYASRTGGITFNLCRPDWSPFLDELGLQTSGLKREYFLSKIPVTDPWSLNVKVVLEIDGNTVTRRFNSCLSGDEVEDLECDVIYNAGRNSIVFLEYVPEPFSEIFVEYNIREIYQAVDTF